MGDTIILIPARGGSKRISKKNICDLNGLPLISYTIKLALKLNMPTYVSTEDQEIAETSKSYGANIINRPKSLAKDSSLDIPWILHALHFLYKKENWHPKKIILLRPTTPLRDLRIVKTTIKQFDNYYTSFRSVEPITEAIEKTLRTKRGLLYPVFGDDQASLAPNQSFETSYRANGYIDILRTEHITENNNLYGNKCKAIITPRTIEIDTWEDLDYAEYLLKKHTRT